MYIVPIVTIIPFLRVIYWVLTLPISPKESGIFPRIGVVGQSEQEFCCVCRCCFRRWFKNEENAERVEGGTKKIHGDPGYKKRYTDWFQLTHLISKHM